MKRTYLVEIEELEEKKIRIIRAFDRRGELLQLPSEQIILDIRSDDYVAIIVRMLSSLTGEDVNKVSFHLNTI